MRAAVLLLPAALVVAALHLARATAQEPAGTDEAVHFGAGSCAAQACHGGAFAERSEYKVWSTRDKHAKAFDILAGDLGRRIGERLGIDPAKSERCLNCHGAAGVATAETYDPHDGVSCEQCHGGAEHWLGPHAAPAWAKKSPAEKERLGLRDLSTPETRAAACVSCHVAGKGRDITHDIMAAGHPPLVFDAAKFLQDMPPHWQDEQDLSIPTWAVGQRANAVALLARLSRLARAAKGTPDFAVFDCYSCHHPVYSGSVYEKSAPPGGPGDLPLELASLKVLLTAVGDEAESQRFSNLLTMTFAPDSYARDFALIAQRGADDVADLFPGAHRFARAEAETMLANLDAHLARVADGKERAGQTEMQQIAFAIHALSPATGSASFAAAFSELDRALGGAYDAALCARLARAAIQAE